MNFLANPLLSAMMVSVEDTQPESGITVETTPPRSYYLVRS